MMHLERCAAALLSTVLVAHGSGCADHRTATEPSRPVDVPFTTIVQASIPGQSAGQLRQAARDAAAWQALWAELYHGSAQTPPLPAVDFSREMVIAAAMATQSCVSRVTIRVVTRSADGLIVNLLEAPPAPNCICVVAERPIHVIRLARFDGPVRFTAERGVTSCG